MTHSSTLRILAVAIGLFSATGTTAAAPVDGLWRTETRGGIVRIAPCGVQVCGTLDDSPDLRREPDATDARNRDASKRSRPLKGVTLLDGFSGGPDRWTGGTIYNPEDGRTYRSELSLAGPDTLKVKGCVGPFCRTQTWTRAR